MWTSPRIVPRAANTDDLTDKRARRANRRTRHGSSRLWRTSIIRTATSGGEDQEVSDRRPRLVGVSAVLNISLVLMALLVLGGSVLSVVHGMSGPSTVGIAAHVLSAAAGLVLYRVICKSSAAARVWATGGILALIFGLLWFFWWR